MTTTILDRTAGAITFKVDDVEPATRPAPMVSPRDAVFELTGVKIEAASDLVRRFVLAKNHGLVATAGLAFMEHRPLVLGPDAVWQAIAQGFADHVNASSDSLRARLVPHQGKRRLVVPLQYLHRSPENPWAAAFERMAELVRKHSHPEAIRALDVDFSTSTSLERAARAFVLLDAFQSYFEYEFMCICGIPWVRLEGTPDDWRRIAEKLDAIGAFGLEWWTNTLKPVIRALWKTASGEPDLAFWKSIYQVRDEHGGYGGPRTYISGWICRFAPYIGEAPDLERNPIVTGAAKDISPGSLPKGFAQVPFFLGREDGVRENKVAIAGVLGMDQDPETLALRPRILWAVGDEPKTKVRRYR